MSIKQTVKEISPDFVIQFAQFIRQALSKLRLFVFEQVELPVRYFISKRMLLSKLQNGNVPRIAIVKQDVNEDLYCCPAGSSPKEIISSTILRPGPVALFTRFNADFYILETEPDEECNVWKEKWTENKWCPLEWFEAFRDKVPGRPYGQKDFAVKSEDIDWSKYDVVISFDVSVPARITKKIPSVSWCYYIREIKTGSYIKSSSKPVAGQDIFLNQFFRPMHKASDVNPHEADFPYHLHYYGCFHELFEKPLNENGKKGVFLEHHTVACLTSEQLNELEEFGPVSSTAIISEERKKAMEEYETVRTIEPEFMDKMMKSKYFVKCGGRAVFGTAFVEAIAAGCLAVGDPDTCSHGFIFSKHTTARTFEEVMQKIGLLERNEGLYLREVARQRMLLNYLCYTRPVLELLRKADKVIEEKIKRGLPITNDKAGSSKLEVC